MGVFGSGFDASQAKYSVIRLHALSSKMWWFLGCAAGAVLPGYEHNDDELNLNLEAVCISELN